MMNKIKEILDTRNKKIIALVSAVVAIVVTSISVYALSNNTKKELLKVVESVTLEYGEDAFEDAKLYIDTTDLSKEAKDKVLKEAMISFPDIEIENEISCPKIGEYTVVVTYQEEKKETRLIVEDTTPPVFNDVDEVTFEQGTEDFPYHEHIIAEDLQEVVLLFESETVDINTPGEYIMLVIATDASGNTAEKEIKVIVTVKQVEDEPQEQQNTETNSNTNNSNNNTHPNTGGNNNQPNSNNGTPNTGSSNSSNQGANSGGNTPPPTAPTPPAPTPPTPPQNPYANANLVISAPDASGRSNHFWFANGARNDNWVWDYLSSSENINGHGYTGFGWSSNGHGGVVYWLRV